jgi:hypothetical protein
MDSKWQQIIANYNKPDLARYAKGRAAWNKWANSRVAARKKLEKNGGWQTKICESGDIEPANDRTRKWMDASWSGMQGHEFRDFADFSGFIFPWHVTFDQGGDYANPVATKFLGGADFSSATFLGDARFDHAIFKLKASFKATEFVESAIFDNASFEGDVTFESAKFSFEDRMFNGNYGDEGEINWHPLEFKSVEHFNNGASFAGSKFVGDVSFQGAALNKNCYASFYEAFLNGKPWYRDSIESNRMMVGCHFSEPPPIITPPSVEPARPPARWRRLWPF